MLEGGGGFREFAEDPANAWEPYPQGAPGEFRSMKTYAFGGGFGNFGDSMVPFHRYLSFSGWGCSWDSCYLVSDNVDSIIANE